MLARYIQADSGSSMMSAQLGQHNGNDDSNDYLHTNKNEHRPSQAQQVLQDQQRSLLTNKNTQTGAGRLDFAAIASQNASQGR